MRTTLVVQLSNLTHIIPNLGNFSILGTVYTHKLVGVLAITACPNLGESGDSQEALNRRVLARLIRRGLERCGDPILDGVMGPASEREAKAAVSR